MGEEGVERDNACGSHGTVSVSAQDAEGGKETAPRSHRQTESW